MFAMAVEIWTSPGGTYQVKKYIPDGYENQTREEWAERLGLDLSVFQYEDPETPDEKDRRVAEAVAELSAFSEEEGLTLSKEEQAELAALFRHLGYRVPNGEVNAGMTGVTYGTGALIAAERRNPRMINLHQWIVDNGIRPVVPAGVLAQVWRGGYGRQAPLTQMLKQCRVETLGENLAKQVSLASLKTGPFDVVDISVVVSAMGRGDRIVTGDKPDIDEIITSLGCDLETFSV